MQAIETEYRQPTDTRGAKITARCQGAKVVVPYLYDSKSGDHDHAARALIVKMGWFGAWVRGGRADGKGEVYVCLAREYNGRLKTPHPQAVDPRDLLIVREES